MKNQQFPTDDVEEQAQVEKQLSPIEQFQLIPKNTMDEGITDTLSREFSNVMYKFTFVLLPRGSHDGTNRLRNWDLWGPFLMCLIFGLFINNSTQFILLFFAVFVGAMVVTFNTRVLGGQISFFQSVAILGYCLFPLFMAVLILQIMRFVQFNNKFVRLAIIGVACLWSILSSRAFVAVNVAEDRKFVALYPICVFYIFMAVLLMYM